jgi:hypothetical protein
MEPLSATTAPVALAVVVLGVVPFCGWDVVVFVSRPTVCHGEPFDRVVSCASAAEATVRVASASALVMGITLGI